MSLIRNVETDHTAGKKFKISEVKQKKSSFRTTCLIKTKLSALNDNVHQLLFLSSLPLPPRISICLCSHLPFSQKAQGKKKKKHQKHLFCGNISWVLITLFEVSLQKRRMRHWTQKELNSQRKHFFFFKAKYFCRWMHVDPR